MNSLTTTTKLQLDGPASWPIVKYWADLAAKFQHASVAAQVMAGFTLRELHKANNIKSGSRTDLVAHNLPHGAGGSGGGESWADMVRDYAGISEDTARRWMAMADGIKARWKKLAPQARLRELMSVPVSDWTDKDAKLVVDSLHKCTDGMGQMEFMIELGISKGARGGRKPGCDAGGNDTTAKDGAEDPDGGDVAEIRGDLVLLADEDNDVLKKESTTGLLSLQNAMKVLDDRIEAELKTRKRTS